MQNEIVLPWEFFIESGNREAKNAYPKKRCNGAALFEEITIKVKSQTLVLYAILIFFVCNDIFTSQFLDNMIKKRQKYVDAN